jgi:hypothetical protein
MSDMELITLVLNNNEEAFWGSNNLIGIDKKEAIRLLVIVLSIIIIGVIALLFLI